MTDHVKEIIEGLSERLGLLGYTGRTAGRIGDVEIAAAFTTDGKRSPKLACAVAQLPTGVQDVRGAGEFIGKLRKSLAKEYAGGFPWPRKMGTFAVLLVSEDMCERLLGREGTLIDAGSMHVNVMLGAVLVDMDTFRTRSDNTWGVIETGDHFQQIQAVLAEWCRSHRQPKRMARAWSNGAMVSVA